MRHNNAFFFWSGLALSALCSSCGNVKYGQLLSFEHIEPGQMSLDSVPVLSIQTDDILNIQVASRNPETVAAFRVLREGVAASSSAALGTPEGYRVDENGYIFLPFLGGVKAAGKTLQELRKEIADQMINFIPDASVQVRFVNFRVTLMGEVRAPNTYIIPNERLTILEAIGMAGDFTEYARRNAVLVIRERNEVREFARVNIQDPRLFASPYFYLSPNDIVYVEPLKAKQYATQGDFFQRYAALLFPIVTLFTFFLGMSVN